jgi:hypothetical protein
MRAGSLSSPRQPRCSLTIPRPSLASASAPALPSIAPSRLLPSPLSPRGGHHHCRPARRRFSTRRRLTSGWHRRMTGSDAMQCATASPPHLTPQPLTPLTPSPSVPTPVPTPRWLCAAELPCLSSSKGLLSIQTLPTFLSCAKCARHRCFERVSLGTVSGGKQRIRRPRCWGQQRR